MEQKTGTGGTSEKANVTTIPEKRQKPRKDRKRGEQGSAGEKTPNHGTGGSTLTVGEHKIVEQPKRRELPDGGGGGGQKKILYQIKKSKSTLEKWGRLEKKKKLARNKARERCI